MFMVVPGYGVATNSEVSELSSFVNLKIIILCRGSNISLSYFIKTIKI